MSREPIFPTTQRRTSMVIALALLGGITSSAAYAAAPCGGVEQQLTDASKREYAQLVAESMTEKVKPSQVEISNLIESGSWSAVYAPWRGQRLPFLNSFEPQ